ncbi:MAG: hypothetical protein RQ864_02475 [Lutibacter sp.]|nr:hypothetical protein [Lutibacter sp.]
MVLSLKIYINQQYQNEVLVDFVKPFFEKLILKQAHVKFYFRRVLDINSHHIHIYFTSKNNISQLKNKFKREWKIFLNENLKLLETIDNSIDSIFLKYPNGHLLINIEPIQDGFLIDDSMTNVSCTNLKILRTNNESEESIINAFEVLLFCLGGYSQVKIIEIANLLSNLLEFSRENLDFLNSTVEEIIFENGSSLNISFNKNFEELCGFYNLDTYPSEISEWKYSYGLLSRNSLSGVNDYSVAFNQFKNQLGLSDSETYCYLYLIGKFQ